MLNLVQVTSDLCDIAALLGLERKALYLFHNCVPPSGIQRDGLRILIVQVIEELITHLLGGPSCLNR